MKKKTGIRITRGKVILALVLLVGSFLYFRTVYWAPRSWESHNRAGLEAYRQGRFTESELEFLAAMDQAEIIPDNQLSLRHTLNNILEVYRNQGKYEQAARTILRIIAIDETHLGKDHPNVAASWHNLAEIYRKQGKVKDSKTCYLRALEILDKRLGREHPFTGFVRERFGELLPKGAKPNPGSAPSTNSG